MIKHQQQCLIARPSRDKSTTTLMKQQQCLIASRILLLDNLDKIEVWGCHMYSNPCRGHHCNVHDVHIGYLKKVLKKKAVPIFFNQHETHLVLRAEVLVIGMVLSRDFCCC